MIWLFIGLLVLIILLIMNKDIKRYIKSEALENRMPAYIPKNLLGKKSVLEQKIRKLNGQIDCNSLVQQIQLKTSRRYLIILILFALGCIVNAGFQIKDSGLQKSIERPEALSTKKTIDASVRLYNDQYSYEKNVILSLKPKVLTTYQIQTMLSTYAEELPSVMMNNNSSLTSINDDLLLPQKDKLTGIDIQWMSSDSTIINERGQVDTLNIKEKESVTLQAIMTLGNQIMKKDYLITVISNQNQKQAENILSRKIDALVDELNDSNSANQMELPDQTADRFNIDWHKTKNDNGFTLMILTMLLLIAVYFKRYESIDKAIKQKRNAIERDFPGFVSKFIMLLNAGVVVSSAISRISLDYERNSKIKETRPLYDELLRIDKMTRESNASLAMEIRLFAERCGIREVLRFALILNDNLSKGSVLAEKLEAESEMMWQNRKKRVEELGKLADTKLTFPLTILLLVLIMVTITPALLAM
jgi:tight adherence protein C